MKTVGLFLLTLLLGFGGFVGYRAYSAKQASARAATAGQTIDEQAFINEMTKASVLDGVAAMQQYIGPEGRAMLKGLADKFPQTGTGIGYQPRLAESTKHAGDDTLLIPRVEYVFRGSAAEKAGIQPGDDVTGIDGVSLVIRCAKGAEGCPSREAVAAIRSAVEAAEKKPSSFTIGCIGEGCRERALNPTPYGQEIHDFTVQHLDGYYKYLDQVAPKVAEFAKKAETADPAGAQALMAEAKDLFTEVTVPFTELDAFFQTRLILPPKPTQSLKPSSF